MLQQLLRGCKIKNMTMLHNVSMLHHSAQFRQSVLCCKHNKMLSVE